MHKEGETHDEGVDDEVTEATLEEILAELDELDGKEEGAINEAEGDDEDEAADDAAEGETKDNTELVKLTVGELKDVLSGVLSQVQGGSAEMGDETDEMGDEAGEGSEEAPLSLDEILAEMQAQEEGKEDVNEYLEGQSMGKAIGGFVQGLLSKLGISTGGLDLADLGGIVGSVAGMGGIVLSAILLGKAGEAKAAKQLEPMKGKIQAAIDAKSGGASGRETSPLGEADKDHAMQNELKMAKETIAELRESINEINLLNAKLLYMNKIFKAKSLTESEKVKVVKAFDRNASIKEVKNTYETLKESIQAKKSQVIKESVGFASKPIGVAPKTNIVEADAFVSRWQKIAGIK
jgi:hypothetical protein